MNCILITNNYPIKKGETFIINEIDYLSNGFDNVYIFVINGKTTDALLYELPKNVRVFPLESYSGRMKYPFFLLKGLFCKGIDSKSGNTIIHHVINRYALGRANDVAIRICDIISDEKLLVDDLVIYSYWFTYQALAAVLLAKRLNKSSSVVVSRAHGYDLYSERNAGNYLPYQEYLLKELDKVYTCSRDGYDYLCKKYPVCSKKVDVSYLGTIFHGMNPILNDRNSISIVSCSSIVPVKRVKLIADAIVELEKRTEYHISWICIGDGPLLSELKEFTAKNIKKSEVIFCGQLENSKVLDVYKTNRFSVFVNTSDSEGLPVSIMEATSFGIPVIATDVGGTGEIVNSQNGLLVSKEIDGKQLADAIILVAHKNYDREIVHDSWTKSFNAEVNYKLFIEDIKCIVATKNS